MNITVEAKCPYCGYENRITMDINEVNRPFVVLCDCEGGTGCDRYFAIQVNMKPVVKVYSMKEL